MLFNDVNGKSNINVSRECHGWHCMVVLRIWRYKISKVLVKCFALWFCLVLVFCLLKGK